MTFQNKKREQIFGNTPLPIPVDHMRTKFGPSIGPPGSCPETCWRKLCSTHKHNSLDPNCGIESCHLLCHVHFNPDFFPVVAGIASVELLPPTNIFYPKTAIPIQIGDRIHNYYSLCRACSYKMAMQRELPSFTADNNIVSSIRTKIQLTSSLLVCRDVESLAFGTYCTLKYILTSYEYYFLGTVPCQLN